MLVLSRKKNEQIVLPDLGITITVVDIRGNQVRLGISAPPDVPVHRKEVWAQIQQWHETPADCVSTY